METPAGARISTSGVRSAPGFGRFDVTGLSSVVGTKKTGETLALWSVAPWDGEAETKQVILPRAEEFPAEDGGLRRVWGEGLRRGGF